MKKVILPLLAYNNGVQTHTVSTTTATPLKKKINVVATTGLTLHLPSAKSKMKEFTVIAVGYAVAVTGSVSTDKITSGAGTSAATCTIASTNAATFRSGKSIAGVGMWYRVS